MLETEFLPKTRFLVLKPPGYDRFARNGWREKIMIRDCKLLEGLSSEDVNQFIASGESINSPKGSKIISSGDTGKEIYIIISGSVECVVYDGDEVARTVATFGRGEIVGEIAFLTGTVRTADVIASEDCEILVFYPDALQKFMLQHPVVASKILLNLASIVAERLIETTHQLVISDTKIIYWI